MVSGHPGTDIRLAWYPIGNFELKLNEYLSHPPTPRDEPRPVDAYGYNMMVFEVTDVDAAAKKLAASGGTVITEPAEMDGGTIVFARDPGGNLLGLFDAPEDSIVSMSRFLER